LISFSSCGHVANKSIVLPSDNQPDSVIVLYDRQAYWIFWDEARTYETFIKRRGAPLLRMIIQDSSVISSLDSVIRSSTPELTRNYVSTDFLILRFRNQMTDTIALDHYPGFFQIRDTVYRDSLVYKIVMDELARKDSLWLNESIDGAVFYQSCYLGNKKAEEQFYQKYPLGQSR
jgi:hypothetical protein